MPARKPTSEMITHDHWGIGTVEGDAKGFRAFGPQEQFIGSFKTSAEARQAVYALHRDGQAALMRDGGRQ